jgi:hypothetical protein
VWAVPGLLAVGTGNIDAAASADRFGQGQAFGDLFQIRLPLSRVGVEQIDPAADFGDGHVMLGERLGDGPNAVRVVELSRRTIGRSVAELTVYAGQLLGVVARARDLDRGPIAAQMNAPSDAAE